MSSTLVCRNFMSCSDLQETTTTLKLKVLNTNPKAAAHHQESQDFGSWAFLPTHRPTKHCSQDQEEDNICRNSSDSKTAATTSYTTARPYNYSPRLSQESLELCTENLGSESGTDAVFASDIPQEHSDRPAPQDPTAARERIGSAVKLRRSPAMMRRKGNDIPPPLTTMSGPNPLQVTRHVENGRLIIEAVERPLRNGVLQAERGGGRLRLSFLKPAEDRGNEAEEDHEVEKDAHGVSDSKYQWMSRCKEGGHGGNINSRDDSNWHKPALWVVTS